MLLFNECLMLSSFISLWTQSGKFWIHPLKYVLVKIKFPIFQRRGFSNLDDEFIYVYWSQFTIMSIYGRLQSMRYVFCHVIREHELRSSDSTETLTGGSIGVCTCLIAPAEHWELIYSLLALYLPLAIMKRHSLVNCFKGKRSGRVTGAAMQNLLEMKLVCVSSSVIILYLCNVCAVHASWDTL
jgi:hypothetical protein